MNIEEIKEEIARIEQSETTWQNIQRLSWLYIVCDHMTDVRVDVRAIEKTDSGKKAIG